MGLNPRLLLSEIIGTKHLYLCIVNRISSLFREPSAESALLTAHIEQLHLRNRVRAGHPHLRLTALDFIDKLLQHISVRYRIGRTWQTSELAARLLEGVSLMQLALRPCLDYFPSRANSEGVLDIDAVSEEAEEGSIK